jgi:Tfp pilus assembly protein PilX
MERGIALVVVLVLLAILTLLVIASAGTATAELTMAGNEQYRKLASDAASSGIERALVRVQQISSAPDVVALNEGAATIRYAREEAGLPQSSAEKLIGYHYVIDSVGNSLRGAVDEQSQGVLMLVPILGTSTFHRMESGLTGGSGP